MSDATVETITTTIDAAGRIVIPKSVRDAAGLIPGTKLQLRVSAGRVEIEPSAADVKILRRGRIAVAHLIANGGEKLTAETVRRVQHAVRSREH